MFVRAFDFVAKTGGKILLVANHYIHMPRQFAVYLPRLIQSPTRLPKRWPVIQVVRNNDSMPSRRSHRLENKLLRAFAQCCEDATSMKPARAVLSENVIPVKSSRSKLARRRIPAIGNSHRATRSKAAFGKVQTVSHLAANAVKIDPPDEFRINAPLQYEILKQTSDIIVGKRSADRGSESEASAQSSRHVILATALPDFEFARRTDAPFTRIKPQHDLAERNQIISALRSRLDC